MALDIGAQRTSRLRLGLPAATIDTLWHMTRAEIEGVTAG
jgi:hypothetical protein